jgi:hypothetical protein
VIERHPEIPIVVEKELLDPDQVGLFFSAYFYAHFVILDG